MKQLSAALILALYASSTLASTLPSTVTTTTTTIPGNSSLLDDVIEATNARNNLKVVPSSQIGQTLVTQAELSSTAALSGYAAGAAGLAGLAYYQRTGKDPVYALFQAVASAADAIFVPGYQAFKANFVSPESFPASAAQYVGKEGSVGLTVENLVNLVNGNPSQYPLIKGKIDANSTPSGYQDNQFQQGTVYRDYAGVVRVIDQPFVQVGWDGYSYYNMNAAYEESVRPGSRLTSHVHTSGEWIYKFIDGAGTFQAHGTASSATPISPTAGSVNYPGLAQAIKDANSDAAFADEVRNAVKNAPTAQKITSSDPQPSSVPAQQPSPITNSDVSNFFTSNTTNIYNEYLNTVNNGGDVNIAQAAADLAKAQEEEAEKQTEEKEEEKFNSLDANPFQDPYNPGPFDIPTRFTTFLHNVKSSGLFSFSTSFFNSLPGGGSPLLTIDGGQTFGTHTFDFSQSLGSGLIILKSALLALFGFLSVRAVIMKR